MSSFLDAVNQVLRRDGIIRGDDDALTTFTDTTHNATSQIAQIAVQDEISSLISDGLLNYQHKTSTITLQTGQRSYNLAGDFISLWGEPPFFYDVVQNVHIFEWPGGENNLRQVQNDYLTVQGGPLYWYLEQTTTKKVSFFQLPDSSYNNRVYNYDYYADVNVVNSTDTLPVQNADEFNAFCGMATVRFKYLFREELRKENLDLDPTYKKYRATFMKLTRGKKLATRYGSVYLSTV
jgi:hypothetical protein